MRATQTLRFFLTVKNAARGFKPMRGTGDKGQSSLFNNERRWKDDSTFNALGNTDELSSWLGVCRESSAKKGLNDITETLTKIQCILQDLGGHIATPPESSERKKNRTKFDDNFVQYVHQLVDEYGDKVPPIRQFILSGGGELSAQIQFGRTICRRTERSLVPLIRDEAIDENALIFLNRLSDLLFVLGRYACLKTHDVELTYLAPLQDVKKELEWKATHLASKKDEKDK